MGISRIHGAGMMRALGTVLVVAALSLNPGVVLADEPAPSETSTPQPPLANPTVTAPPRATLGTTINATGKFDTTTPITIYGQVWIPHQRRWSNTPKTTTNTTGRYTLPINYQANRPGTQTWRITGQHPDGTQQHTKQFTITRIGSAQARITATTAAELAGYHHAGCPMKPSRLRTVTVNYYDYSGQVRRGSIVVRDNRAGDVAYAFTQMFNAKFRIARMDLPTRWKGSDTAMMAANNTSGYNCRKVTGNPYRWSPHAYGYAVDINPAQNPYLDPKGKWWPSSQWSRHRPAGVKGMHYPNSASVRAFTSRGWKWFSGWDWHHFERR